MNGEESRTPDERAADEAEGKEGFLKLPLIGGLVVPSVPSSNGAAPAPETENAARA